MLLKKFISVAILCSAFMYGGNSIGLNVNGEDFEIEGAIDINAFSEYTNGVVLVADANYINTDIDDLIGVGLSAHSSFQEAEGVDFGAGLRYIYLEDFGALPLMIQAAYAIPLGESLPTVSISGEALFAPSFLSFSEANNYMELRAEAGIEAVNAIWLYAGYRYIETDYHGALEETFNDSFYGGLKVGF